jgi:hypothetical protein
MDAREAAEEYFFGYSVAYWTYTREIATRLYGDPRTAWQQIAITNLVKCTNVEGEDPGNAADATTTCMASSCIADLQVIAKEIRILEPRHVIFYTYSFFSHLLARLEFEEGCAWHDVTSPDHRVTCGAKQLGWWDRICSTTWCSSVRVLIIGHPERMHKEQYVALVVAWLNDAT